MNPVGHGEGALRMGPGLSPALGDDQASALRRLVDASAPGDPGAARAARHCRTIAIASGKGGVGKTTLAVNLCVGLAARGLRVALLDADLGLANADVMCGVTVRSHLGHVLSGERAMSDIVLETPGGFRLIPGASGVGAIADLDVARLERLLLALGEVERGCDLLVIDCGAGIGRGVMTFLSAAEAGVIVATPEPTSVAGAYATIKCLMARGGRPAVSRTTLFVNQARSAAEAERVRGRVAQVAQRFLGVEVSSLGWAPVEGAVGEAIRARRPLALERPRSAAACAIRGAGDELVRRMGVSACGTGARSSFVRRLLGL